MSVALPLGDPGSAPPVVPGYTLEALLGRGGSGEVWRAVPRRGGAAVAVKVLVAGDPERQAREAALLGELDHPHLVRLIEVVHQPRRGGETRVALVLELLDGGSLAALMARRGRLRPGEVVTAIAPVAAALAHAHEHGVVHGDLSPGNIVFTGEGRPVLTDLGVARVLGETAAGEVTPAYVRRLEDALIEVCAGFGLTTGRVEGRSGVWVAADEPGAGFRPERKVAAIGVRVARGVTMHGFALNCDPDMAAFSNMIPCGIPDAGVTSLSAELGRDITVADAIEPVEAAMRRVLAFEPAQAG